MAQVGQFLAVWFFLYDRLVVVCRRRRVSVGVPSYHRRRQLPIAANSAVCLYFVDFVQWFVPVSSDRHTWNAKTVIPVTLFFFSRRGQVPWLTRSGNSARHFGSFRVRREGALCGLCWKEFPGIQCENGIALCMLQNFECEFLSNFVEPVCSRGKEVHICKWCSPLMDDVWRDPKC